MIVAESHKGASEKQTISPTDIETAGMSQSFQSNQFSFRFWNL